MGLPGSLWRDKRRTSVGALYGVGAFLAGYAATLLLQYDKVDTSDQLLADIGALLGPTLGRVFAEVADWIQPDPLQVVGWFFYNSHYVPLEIRATALGQHATASVSLRQTPLWTSALVLVPPVVLLFAGYLFARRQHETGAGSTSPLESGARIAVGYAATGAFGSAAVAYSRDAGIAAVAMGPQLTTAALYCGGYALLFGTLGGLLHTAYGSTEHRQPGSEPRH